MAERSLAKRLWYDYLQVMCRLLGVALFRVRCTGRENVPPTGGVLVLSNHQSQFDPMLVGLAIDRRLNYLARETLFRFPPFRWLIRSLDAIPIDREGLGLAGLKETLRRLNRVPPTARCIRSSRAFRPWRSGPACRSCRWPSTARSTPGHAGSCCQG